MQADMEPTSSLSRFGEPVTPDSFPPKIAAGIKQLNVDPSNERFMKLVDDLLRPESLPRGWTAGFDEASGSWWYKDKAGVQYDKHPVYTYYITAMFMDMGGYAQLKRTAAEHPPTAEEVEQMGLYLKIKKEEDKYIWQVAEMALCAPLPPGWQETVSDVDGNPMLVFKENATGSTQQEHPMDDYFRELIRRRRKELLRRKKAALKSLQALVKLGMRARLSQLSALPAAKSEDRSTENDGLDEDIESLDPVAQHQLLTAWQGLLGTAVGLVHSMQTAQWDRGITVARSSKTLAEFCLASDVASTAAAVGSTAGSTTDGVAGTTAGSTMDSAAGSTAGRTAEQLAAVQQRLSDIDAVLRSALDPNDGLPDAAAATALSEIEALAMQMQAAGDNAEALVCLLAGQGISLPDLPDSASSASSGPASAGLTRIGSLGAEVDSTPTRRRPSLMGSPRASTAGSDKAQPQCTSRLNSRQVDFAGVDAGTAAAVGSTGSTTGTAGAGVTSGTADAASTGSTTGTAGAPSSDIEHRVVPAKAGFFNKISIMWPNKDGARNNAPNTRGSLMSFIGAHVGPSSDGSTTSEGWSLTGGKPTAAGAAAAASVRALAALKRESGINKDAAERGLAAANSSSVTVGSESGAQSVTQKSCHVHFRATTARASPATPDQALQPGLLQESPQLAASSESELQATGMFVSSATQPVVTAALQHMSALQAGLQEAASLVHSWQQQKIIIALLQLRLREAAADAQDGQQRLAAARQQIDKIRADQADTVGAASVALAEYQSLLQKLQEVQGELMRIQEEKQLWQDGHGQFQASLEAAVAAAAAAADKQQRLDQQLQQVQQQLEEGRVVKDDLQAKLQATTAQLASLREHHSKQQASAGSDLASTSAELSALQTSHRELQSEHERLQGALATAKVEAQAAQEQQQQLLQQLQQTQLQLQQLQEAFAALQLQYQHQGEQYSECQQVLGELQAKSQQQQEQLTQSQQQHQQLQQEHELLKQQMTGSHQDALQLQTQAKQQQEHLQQLQEQIQAGKQTVQQLQQQLEEKQKQQQEQIALAQQQLQQLQQEKQQTEQQHLQLQAEKEQLLEQHLQLLDKQNEAQIRAKVAQKEIADMQAAATAAEERRLANPKRSTQVSATDAIEQHWVRSRGVETGDELDPRNKKDVGTPADLSLISFFFRDIKAKQRGGGGAVIGYDAEGARAAAACAVPPGCAALWTGQPSLPPISRDGSREPSTARRRPATMPGSTRAPARESLTALPPKQQPEPVDETGRFDTRPAPWEVRARVDRRRDRSMRLETDPTEGGAVGDRWDYSHDERDNEIAELKKRLVEEQRKTKESAAKSAADLGQVMEQLQASKRSVEQLQSDNFALRKELDSLRLAIHTSDVSAAYHESASAAGSSLGLAGALRPSVFGGGLSASKALGGRTSGVGSVGTAGSLGSSIWGSGLGAAGGSTAGAERRSSVALLSLSVGAGAAGLPGLPATSVTGGVSTSSSGGGNGGPRAFMFAGAGRSSVTAAQSLYTSPAVSKGGPRVTSAGKSQLVSSSTVSAGRASTRTSST